MGLQYSWDEAGLQAAARWEGLDALATTLPADPYPMARGFQLFKEQHSVEDASRVLKQEFQLEALRVLGWTAVRRLVALVSLAYGFVCRIGLLPHRLLLQLLDRVRCFRRPRKVIAYHLRKGLAELWDRGLICRPSIFG